MQAQQIIERSWPSEDITSLKIDGEFIHKIFIETEATNTISVKSRIEGEYHEQVVLVSEVDANTLHISAKFQPLFVKANDKLSAHKIQSVTLEVKLPSHMTLLLSAINSEIDLNGNYKNVIVDLKSGFCRLKNFSGEAIVNTIDANISVNTTFAIVEAFSKYGIVQQEPVPHGINRLRLKSLNGNITVTKSE